MTLIAPLLILTKQVYPPSHPKAALALPCYQQALGDFLRPLLKVVNPQNDEDGQVVGEDALADDEGQFGGGARVCEVRADGGEGLIAEDLGDHVGDIEAESEDTGKDNHQILVGHLCYIHSYPF